VGNIKLQIAMANILIHRFDVAQDSRDLTGGEWWLRKTLKLTVLGLSFQERTMTRQRSRIRWLREGEGNTKLFHLVAYGRRTNNLMTAIKHGDELIMDQGRNEDLFLQTYQNLIGTIQSREATLDEG
jgi:hypothetical protein